MSQSTAINSTSTLVTKAYTTEELSTKALGGLGSPTDYNGDGCIDDLEQYAYDLKAWLVEQRDSGVQLSQDDLNTIMEYVNYCSSMMGGWDPFTELGWYPEASGFSGGDYSGYEAAGPSGNQTIIDGGDFTVDGSVEATDVWGTASTPANMSVPPPCTVTFETSTDTRTGTNETVVKAIVTNPAMLDADGTPKQSVVYFHDGVPINCHASLKGDGSSRATDATGTVVIDEWTDPAIVAEEEACAVPMANVEAQEMTRADGSIYYVYAGTSTSVIDFNETGMNDGVSTVNDVWGNSSITVSETDLVEIQDGDYSTEYDDIEHRSTVIVTHLDGTTDVFLMHNEYQCNINATPEHITATNKNRDTGKIYTGHPVEDPENEGQIIWPENCATIADHFTVNALESVRFKDSVEAIEEVEEQEAEDSIKYPSVITGMADEMGLSNEELLEALEKSEANGGYGLKLKDEDGDGIISKEEFNEALLKANFPPVIPDKRFIEFLVKFDDELRNNLDASNTDNSVAYMIAMQAATKRTVAILQEAYPDLEVSVTHDPPTYWWEANDITFNGQHMEPYAGNEDDPGIEGFASGLLKDTPGLEGYYLNDGTLDPDAANNDGIGYSEAGTRGEIQDDPFSTTTY